MSVERGDALIGLLMPIRIELKSLDKTLKFVFSVKFFVWRTITSVSEMGVSMMALGDT